MAKKPGAEGDIPYTPWALERMKAERPAYGTECRPLKTPPIRH